MHPLDYATPTQRDRQRTPGWAAAWLFVGFLITSTVGALLALLQAPTPQMSDAPPIMVVCPMPLAAGVIALLTLAYSGFLGLVRRRQRVSRGTVIPFATGAVTGLLMVASFYVPEPHPVVGMLVTFLVIPLTCALLVTRPSHR